jgi:hypothetical protein
LIGPPLIVGVITLLATMFNTGARVQEIVTLRVL